MKSTFAIGGSVGVGIVLLAALVSGILWLSSPAQSVPAAKQMNFPTPDASQLATQSPQANIDQAAQIELIRRILGRPDLNLAFDSVQGLSNAPDRMAAVYVDDLGSRYYIDLETGQLAAIEPGLNAVPENPSGPELGMDTLRSLATRFAQANSARLAELQQSLIYDEGCKGTRCFFRWDASGLPIDWWSTAWSVMPPFLQVGILSNGQIFSYNNTLDLFQGTYPAGAQQPTPEAVVAGGVIEDGPFTFDLRIFQDPTLTTQPLSPSLYSNMEGFGAYMYWTYAGSEVIGPVTTYWGAEPDLRQLLQATYSTVAVGSTGGRTGGILLPAGSKAGDRERLILKVTTPSGEFGAALLFTLQKGSNGLEPTDISIERLQAQ